ncbi:carboxypeptidase-like regulatory domain-containing protein [Phycicoccus sonneratiae]|uniref:Carboxypeptidase regulatory-like domain-containing protein n=1 Tax=Phycicoccus sonneratiae TaxID=2807628 RepID=A0ABS2CGX6_9MICO|nr:carboxypeptidase-like regulatory domain-containing protein [Phycicoccus sonneraticus]MBM6399025.1 carboxypeptidase regulatory-like domain-containing protein [Phycicoccus sonneraticus]
MARARTTLTRLVTVVGVAALAVLPAAAARAAAPSTAHPVAAVTAAPAPTVERTSGVTQLSDQATPEAPGTVLYDSRSQGGALRAKEVRSLDLLSGTPLTAPSDATAVILNVTAVSPSTAGWLTLWPADQSRPAASTLNFAPGTPTPNMAVVRLTGSRTLRVMNGSGGTTHVLVSFRGWVRSNSGQQRPGSLTPTDATRVLDTRLTGPAVPAYGYRDVTVTGVGAPSGASAALLDVVAVKPTRAGYLVAHPSDTARPATTALTYRVGGDRAALSLMRLSSGGAVRVWNMSSAPVHLVVDSFGWVAGGDDTGTPAVMSAQAPVRVLDTRPSIGALSPGHSSVEVPVPGDDQGSPGDRPSGVVLAITATAGTSGGHLDLDVDGNTTLDPAALTPSIVNFGRGETVTNTTVVSVPTGGRLRLHSNTTGSVHAVVDVVGVVRPRTELNGRLVTEDGGAPVSPGAVTFGPSGSFVGRTAADGTYRVRTNTVYAVNACGRATTTQGATDPAYALACAGGTVYPTSMPLGVGVRVSAPDVLVPRVGSATGTVTVPLGSSVSGTSVVLRRTDDAYAVRITPNAAGQWTMPAVPVGDYLVSANAPFGLVGEVLDELPSDLGAGTASAQQARIDDLLAAGAQTLTVSAGAQSTPPEAQLLVPGSLTVDVTDPDGSYGNVTTTWRTASGYVALTITGSQTFTRSLRPGAYTVCATEGTATVCTGGASTWQEATPVTVESGATTVVPLSVP